MEANFDHSETSPGFVLGPTQFGSDQISRFDFYWIQMDRQADKLSIYIEASKRLFLNRRLKLFLE